MCDRLEDNKQYRESLELRLERLITEEKVLTSVIKQIRSQFVVLQSEREEMLSALNKLKEELTAKNVNDEAIASDKKIGVRESSEEIVIPPSSEQLLKPSCLDSNVSDNIGMDFDEVINDNLSTDCFSANLDTLGLGSEFDSLLMGNTGLTVEPVRQRVSSDADV